MLLKVIYDAVTFWLGNTLVYNINPKLEQKPDLHNLSIWTAGNVLIRYHVIDTLRFKGLITSNDQIYFTLAIMSFFVNWITGLEKNLLTNIKINSVGMLSNILCSRLFYKNA